MLTVSEPVENFTETCSPELALHKLHSKTHSFASSRSCKNGQELGFEDLGFWGLQLLLQMLLQDFRI
jgi:hypothetical protein